VLELNTLLVADAMAAPPGELVAVNEEELDDVPLRVPAREAAIVRVLVADDDPEAVAAELHVPELEAVSALVTEEVSVWLVTYVALTEPEFVAELELMLLAMMVLALLTVYDDVPVAALDSVLDAVETDVRLDVPVAALDSVLDAVETDVRLDVPVAALDSVLDAVETDVRLDVPVAAEDSVLDAVEADVRLDVPVAALDSVLDAVGAEVDESVETKSALAPKLGVAETVGVTEDVPASRPRRQRLAVIMLQGETENRHHAVALTGACWCTGRRDLPTDNRHAISYTAAARTPIRQPRRCCIYFGPV
jgi:hypothetical protein